MAQYTRRFVRPVQTFLASSFVFASASGSVYRPSARLTRLLDLDAAAVENMFGAFLKKALRSYYT
jgi:hypothetical protein